MSSAQWLQKKGFSPVLIDQDQPGNGASYGNACTFASYGCVPVNTPEILKMAPGLLFGKKSPLKINWSCILQLSPWLFRFLMNCRPSQLNHIAESLARLLNISEQSAMLLFDDAGIHSLINRRGCLYLYESERDFNKAAWDLELRRKNNVAMEILDQGTVREMEPELASIFYNAVHFPGAFNFIDPRAVIQKMCAHFEDKGGSFVKAKVTTLSKSSDGVITVHLEDGQTLHCKQLVLALGAWSNDLSGDLIEPMPLGCERGYHVVFHGQDKLLSRPIGWGAGGFYLTPMAEGLRAAGTVELGGMSAQKRLSTLEFMSSEARRILPALKGNRDGDWLGFRPSFPDALPVIGRSSRTPEIILAFGHQHLGMTLGPVTGEIVADMARRHEPKIDITPYRSDRF